MKKEWQKSFVVFAGWTVCCLVFLKLLYVPWERPLVFIGGQIGALWITGLLLIFLKGCSKIIGVVVGLMLYVIVSPEHTPTHISVENRSNLPATVAFDTRFPYTQQIVHLAPGEKIRAFYTTEDLTASTWKERTLTYEVTVGDFSQTKSLDLHPKKNGIVGTICINEQELRKKSPNN